MPRGACTGGWNHPRARYDGWNHPRARSDGTMTWSSSGGGRFLSVSGFGGEFSVLESSSAEQRVIRNSELPWCKAVRAGHDRQPSRPSSSRGLVEYAQVHEAYLSLRPNCRNMTTQQKQRIQVPDCLRDVLLEFSIAYLLEQPGDVIDYAVEFFSRLQENRKATMVQSGDLPSPDESIMSQDEEPVVQRFAGRRKSVFAEAYDPENDPDEDEGATAIFPKTDEQRTRLIESVRNILLFRSLDKEQMNQVLDAMFEKKVQPEEYIIRQGDDGDNFYVIESGAYKAFVGDNHIHTYDNSGSFGELALLYNMPRAASIQAETIGHLWAMDRQTFRRILLKSAFKKRKMYESLLDSVPMLKALQSYERMNLADALISKSCDKGERIIKQGDVADGMYFIEDGTISIRLEQDGGEVEISVLGKGQYFGELALVTHRPRAASAYAVDHVKLAFLDVDAFERLLGNCMEIMKRNIDDYESQLIRIFGSKNNITDTR